MERTNPTKLLRLAWRLLLLLLAPVSCTAPLTVAPLFTDHMVLQRQQPIPVWGNGPAGENIRVTLADRTLTTQALADGSWSVSFPPLPAGGPHQLHIHSSNTTRRLHDLWIGDVWLCAGQSNMELALVHTTGGLGEMLTTTPASPRLLHLEKPARPSFLPPVWTTSTTSDAGTFSGLGWRFGNNLQKENNIPIGLIQATRGNTPIQPWMPHHGEIFQTMIAPLKGIRLKGVVFYQGESSVNLTLRAWVSTSDVLLAKSELLEGIHRELRKRGLSIPYPQRDLHVYHHGAPPAGATPLARDLVDDGDR